MMTLMDTQFIQQTSLLDAPETLQKGLKKTKRTSILHQWTPQQEFQFLLTDMAKKSLCGCKIDTNNMYPKTLERKVKNSKAQKILLNLNKLRLLASYTIELIEQRAPKEKITFFQENLKSLTRKHFNIFKHYRNIVLINKAQDGSCKKEYVATSTLHEEVSLQKDVKAGIENRNNLISNKAYEKDLIKDTFIHNSCYFSMLFNLNWMFSQINKIHEYQDQCYYPKTKKEIDNIQEAREISKRFYGSSDWPLALYPVQYQDPQSVQLKYLAGLDFALHSGGYILLLKLVVGKVDECLGNNYLRQWNTNQKARKFMDELIVKYQSGQAMAFSRNHSQSLKGQEDQQEEQEQEQEEEQKALSKVKEKRKSYVRSRNILFKKQSKDKSEAQEPKILKRMKKKQQKLESRNDCCFFIQQRRMSQRRISIRSSLSKQVIPNNSFTERIQIQQQHQESMMDMNGLNNLGRDILFTNDHSQNLFRIEMHSREVFEQDNLDRFSLFELEAAKSFRSNNRLAQGEDDNTSIASSNNFGHEAIFDYSLPNLQAQRQFSYISPLDSKRNPNYMQNCDH